MSMGRPDLGFILCCCRAFLSGDQSTEENFYDILGVERDATSEEIKRAYKRKSLDLHPDKLAQRGKVATKDDESRFTRMKEAYEVLSDDHKRETYDTIGEKGMKWIDEPFSIDPKEMAHNFASSSVLDRSKIFAIFLVIAIAILLLPILICLQVDGTFGRNAKWTAIATPLWIWDAIILFYHVRVIMMGPIQKPDHIPEEEWNDPLPMSMRYINLVRFGLFFMFQILAVFNLDGIITLKWIIVFCPIYLLEGFTFFKRAAQTKKIIVTVEELESILGKSFSDLSDEEKKGLSSQYIIVQSKRSESYFIARSLQDNARLDMIRITFRSLFIILLAIQLDGDVHWSWWLIFAPFFVMSCCLCCSQCQEYAEVQADAAEKLGVDIETTTDYGAMEEGTNETKAGETLSEEEKEEIKGKVFQAGTNAVQMCCSQTIFLVLVCLCLLKIHGSSFSSLWIISPFLFMASMILCVLGCTIFCISPMDGDDIDLYQNMDQNAFFTTNPTNTTYTGETSTTIPNPSTTQFQTSQNDLMSENLRSQTSNNAMQTKKTADGDDKKKPSNEVGAVETTTTQPQPVDLLDDAIIITNQNEKPATSKRIDDSTGDVGPTESEVDDLD